MSTLLERLDAAKGPDRAIDIEVGKLWADPPFNVTDKVLQNAQPVCPHFTASVDAALSAAAHLLPGWSIRMSYGEGYKHPNVGMGRSYPTNRSVAFDHHTMPLAILLAVVSALQNNEPPER